MDCQLLTLDEAASKVRITRRYLNVLIAAGTGPQVVSLGRRRMVRADDFQAWLDKLPVQSRRRGTADPAQAIITPNLSMYLRLEHRNGTAARRISLSSLASVLAAGILSEGTGPTSTPAPAGTVPPPPAQQASAGSPA